MLKRLTLPELKTQVGVLSVADDDLIRLMKDIIYDDFADLLSKRIMLLVRDKEKTSDGKWVITEAKAFKETDQFYHTYAGEIIICNRFLAQATDEQKRAAIHEALCMFFVDQFGNVKKQKPDATLYQANYLKFGAWRDRWIPSQTTLSLDVVSRKGDTAIAESN